MKKKLTGRMGRSVCAVLSQILAMIMAALLLYLSTGYLMISRYGVYFNDPFKETQCFEETESFKEYFYRDLCTLSEFMAVSAQLETNGVFDEGKTIDVFSYVNRHRASDRESKTYPELIYRVGDLINWESEGFRFEVTEEEQTEVVQTLPYLVESFRPVNLDSIYDLKLPDTMTYDDVTSAVTQAAADLTYNYDWYLKNKSYFENETNLKYMMLSKDQDILLANLENKKHLSASKLVRAFKTNGTYLIYHFEDNTIQEGRLDQDMLVSYKSVLRDFSYSYPQDATLYVAVLKNTSDELGQWHGSDYYAQAENRYRNLDTKSESLLLFALLAGIGSLVFFILFLVFQPRKAKAELRGFDKWFTEIALGFAIITAVIVSGVGTLLTETLSCEIDSISMQARNQYFVIGVFWTFSLLYLLLLLYAASLVRRIKAHAIWNGSLLYYLLHNMKRLGRKAVELGQKGIGLLVNNKFFLVRSLGPYLLLLALHLFFLMMGAFGVFLIFIMDAAVGVFLFLNNKMREEIVKGIRKICDGEVDYQIDTTRLYGENKVIAEAVNRIGEAVRHAVEVSMKDERLKADLITNVSHDIKTPLTSIINYVDLLKRENIPSEKAQEYIRILDEKSQRLKQLTVDLVEASKISSGNITLEMEQLDTCELLKQAIGEYKDKMEEKHLQVIASYPGEEEKAMIYADSRRMWRVLENLFANICKYAMEGTRVYVQVAIKKEAGKQENETQSGQETYVELTIKNISAQQLNIPADELTQRFIRGDISRSTEGSGLGLSIAQNLTLAQGGAFRIDLDGDLFKVVLGFPIYEAR